MPKKSVKKAVKKKPTKKGAKPAPEATKFTKLWIVHETMPDHNPTYQRFHLFNENPLGNLELQDGKLVASTEIDYDAGINQFCGGFANETSIHNLKPNTPYRLDITIVEDSAENLDPVALLEAALAEAKAAQSKQ